MKVDNIYIGEIYEKVNNSDETVRRIGYQSFIYRKEEDCYEELKSRKKYYIDKSTISKSEKFIKKESLVPFNSFAKKPLIFCSRDDIYYICNREIVKRNKVYLNNRYDSIYTPEEIEKIHQRGELTIREKAQDYLEYDVCPLGDEIGSASPRCAQYKTQPCKECLCDYLEKTGVKSFKKLELKPTRTIFQESKGKNE